MFLEKTKALLKANGISKNKMLTDLGLAKNSFVNWQERNTIPNGETLAKIANYFDVSIESLLNDEDKVRLITANELETARKRVSEIIGSGNINIQNLERSLNTNYATLKCWTSGNSDFFNDRISDLADYFNVSTDYLLGRSNNTDSVSDIELRQIIESYSYLNDAGKSKAVDYMNDLASNPSYNDAKVVKIVPKTTAQVAAYDGGVKTIETDLTEDEILNILKDYNKNTGADQ